MQNFIRRYLAHYSGLPRACWLGVMLTLVGAISSGAVFFFVIYFVHDLHIAVVTAGLLLSSYGLGTTCGGLAGGYLADFFKPKWVCCVCFFVDTLIYLALVKVTWIPLLALTMWLLGFCTYTFITANTTMTLQYCRHSNPLKLRTLNMMYISSNVGMAVAAVLISVFDHLGFHTLFIGFAISLLLSGIVLAFYRIPTPAPSNAHANSSNQHTITQNRTRILIATLTTVFLVGLVIGQLSTTFPLFLHHQFPQMGMKAIGIVSIFNAVLIIVFQAPITNHAGRYDRCLLLGFGALLYCGGMGILAFTGPYWVPLLSALTYTLGEMFYCSTAKYVVYQCADEHKKGRNLGRYQSIHAASVILGPTLGTLAYHHLGPHSVWLGCSLLGVICLFIGLYLYRLTRQQVI